MEIENLYQILTAYSLDHSYFNSKEYGSGQINKTFLLENHQSHKKFILQKINTTVFKNPQIIANNIKLANDFISENHPDYYFLKFIKTNKNEDYYIDIDKNYWRLMDYVENSYCIDHIDNVKQSYLTAFEFGKFSAMLSEAPVDKFEAAIPEFHNLLSRYTNFIKAIDSASHERFKKSASLCNYLISNAKLNDVYFNIIAYNSIPIRLVHGDTKINNILFDKTSLAPKCIVDLDTLMPGYFLSDLGDMIRTMVFVTDENETDPDKIIFRKEYYNAICKGYTSAIKLTNQEKKLIPYAGKFMVYMQALRFMTDYLQNDIYYPILYEHHNYDRAQNQVWLLKELFKNT